MSCSGGHRTPRLIPDMHVAKRILRTILITTLTVVALHQVLDIDSLRGRRYDTPSNCWTDNASSAKDLISLQNGQGAPGIQTVAGIPKDKYDFLLDSRVDCNKPWAAITENGRLGNKICSLFHLYNFKYQYGLQVAMTQGMWGKMKDIFPYLHIHLLPKQCFQEIKNMEPVHHKEASQQLDAEGPIRKMFINGTPCSVGKVWFLRRVFIEEFRFAPSILEEAQERLDSLLTTWKGRMSKHSPSYIAQKGDPTVVGVHVRRGDYADFLRKKYNGELCPAEYFTVAFAHAREMFGLVAFVVISDDLEWCKRHLEAKHVDIIVPSAMGRPQVDLALLTLCDHVIASVGSYSTVGALLAGGKFFFPVRNFSESETRYGIQVRGGIMNLTDAVPVWYNHDTSRDAS